MRERFLPTHLPNLPELRQQHHLISLKDPSTTSSTNQDGLSTNLSTTTDDYDDSHAYHVNQNKPLKTIAEEADEGERGKASAAVPRSFPLRLAQQPLLFEKVSTSRGDDSDMTNYDDLPLPTRASSSHIAHGIAYINESIIV